MKKKILYITYGMDFNGRISGIEKKIINQCKCLRNLENEVFLCGETSKSFEIYNTNFKVNYKNKFTRVKERTELLKRFINTKNIDTVYIRYAHFANKSFLAFVKYLHQKNIKVILEIPTYPYDKEYKVKLSFSYLRLMIDKIFRRSLYKYTDKVVTFSEDKEIFKIPCINISNGINLEEIKLVRTKKHKGIVFTSVSSCEFWHGIDRMLSGLEAYLNDNEKSQIIFNIVGQGPEIEKLIDIVDNSKHLNKVVRFLGFKSGSELDEIYNETDIAVGSLGRHRSGLSTMRALKNREYAAKGLPMLFSEDDPDLRNVNFVYHVSADEEVIDISDILNWFEDLDERSEEIRRCSEQFSWQTQMKKVLNEM